MIIVDLDRLRELKNAMGHNEFSPYHNTHSFFRINCIKITSNVDNEFELHFDSSRQETLYRIQYSDIL